MPFVQVHTSASPIPEERARALLKQLSQSLAQNLRKPESYVMTSLVSNARMTFAGTDAPACCVEVKSIGGITPQTTKAMTREITALVGRELGLAPDRVFVVFADIPGHLWGYNGDTLG